MKTAKQINEQADRLTDALLFKSWNGKEYADERYNALFDRVYEISEKYIDNIYKHNGVDAFNDSFVKVNDIWNNYNAPREIYAGF